MSVLAGFNGNFWGCWQGVSQSSKVFEEGVSIIEGAEHATIFEGVGIFFSYIFFVPNPFCAVLEKSPCHFFPGLRWGVFLNYQECWTRPDV